MRLCLRCKLLLLLLLLLPPRFLPQCWIWTTGVRHHQRKSKLFDDLLRGFNFSNTIEEPLDVVAHMRQYSTKSRRDMAMEQIDGFIARNLADHELAIMRKRTCTRSSKRGRSMCSMAVEPTARRRRLEQVPEGGTPSARRNAELTLALGWLPVPFRKLLGPFVCPFRNQT